MEPVSARPADGFPVSGVSRTNGRQTKTGPQTLFLRLRPGDPYIAGLSGRLNSFQEVFSMSEKQSAAGSGGGRELLVRLISGTVTAPMAEQLTAAGLQWRAGAFFTRRNSRRSIMTFPRRTAIICIWNCRAARSVADRP